MMGRMTDSGLRDGAGNGAMVGGSAPRLVAPAAAVRDAPEQSCPDDDLAASAARLYLAMGRLARVLRRIGAGDLGPGTFSALATLARSGPMRLGDLAAREGVAPPTLTRIVAALEDSGLVVRETDPGDRRAVRVAATDEGAALTAGVRSSRSVALRDRMLALSEADRAALLAALPALEALAADEG